MKNYALNYKEKNCYIEGKEVKYKEVFLEFECIEVKVSVPKEVKNQVVENIDKEKCFLNIHNIEKENTYVLTLHFGDYIIPLNNRIFSELELYILSK